MRLFHRHDWIIRRATVCQPVRDVHLGNLECSENMAARMMWGATNYVLTCACGKALTIELIGTEPEGYTPEQLKALYELDGLRNSSN
jgi:hypothetical protein